MCTTFSETEETYRDIIEQTKENAYKEKIDKYYFLIKHNNTDSNFYSLGKINFRDELMLELDDNLKESEMFDLCFNNPEIRKKKEKKKKKEDDLINILESTPGDIISDDKVIEKITTLLKLENNTIDNSSSNPINGDSENLKPNVFLKKGNLHLLENSHLFYDDIFSNIYYITDIHFDFQISHQQNGLSILGISKYSNIFLNILNDFKNGNCNDFKQFIQDNIKIQYDQRLLNADTSGKRKRNTICISDGMNILKIFYANNIYSIKSKISGHQVDINENLIERPHLLLTNPSSAWIVIVKKKYIFTDNYLNAVQYEKEREENIKKCNYMLNLFQKEAY
ncbi:conserved Plasmodium protein, unknown function [Plasmodium berghei]|uniref:Protein Abitram n=2 Tax=Plasmodium berghei TaxID=5821 RepID=A0A509ART3_PLABA|nr:conserved Plasmodium protein, unknown function [Plasmodium berghei ANKA]CXJ09913.1 conserved Plasmodium protein, unknown function [Plasmodium berghei]SCM25923.1 conserved Plasmodium protein, unknown function [Plasmodium berghei]SCN28183.1 conserved Plasmodium protein, unknown function [Plasmodium berghei]SCO62386.1 conserved Plasmodium protein, unknown function [Plasmodium berghei]SCO63944.1 conserved Plasmodium protein, unknown function [Plasmodium berghei]|eukprot:XP_034423840.1 conserved Plasmodium protein, unknown function [Plasmodium berghei ANKA]